jgi:hypothetical protein
LKGRFSELEPSIGIRYTATSDRNIANSLKGFARESFKFAKVMRKIAIKLGTQKRNA